LQSRKNERKKDMEKREVYFFGEHMGFDIDKTRQKRGRVACQPCSEQSFSGGGLLSKAKQGHGEVTNGSSPENPKKAGGYY